MRSLPFLSALRQEKDVVAFFPFSSLVSHYLRVPELNFVVRPFFLFLFFPPARVGRRPFFSDPKKENAGDPSFFCVCNVVKTRHSARFLFPPVFPCGLQIAATPSFPPPRFLAPVGEAQGTEVCFFFL